MSKIFIECECGVHILRAEKEIQDGSCTYYLSMYTYGNSRYNWIRRLKICWNILKTGEIYRDQLVLTEQEFNKLKELK